MRTETYTDAKGRQKKRKRGVPAGLSKRDERILVRSVFPPPSILFLSYLCVSSSAVLTRGLAQRSVRRRAHYLDKGFSLCGFRFGWTASGSPGSPRLHPELR